MHRVPVFITVKVIIPVILAGILLRCDSPSPKQRPATVRFENLLFTSHPEVIGDSLESIDPQLTRFWNLFTFHIIGIGLPGDSTFTEQLTSFVNDPVIRGSRSLADSLYRDLSAVESTIRKALTKADSFLPGASSTRLVTYISGFNESFITLPGILGIGLDNFLGANTLYYEHLGIPRYIRRSMDHRHLAGEAIRAWLTSEIPPPNEESNLLEQMIYQGKICFIMAEILSNTDLETIFRYTPEQWTWAKEHEEAIWKFLAQEKMLFTTSRLDIRRFTEEAPFVREFGEASPGRIGNWIGFRIVSQYVKRSHCSLAELVEMEDVLRILEKARYNP